MITKAVAVGLCYPHGGVEQDMNVKTPGSYSGGCSFSGGVAVVVRWAQRADPSFHRRAVPGDPTSSELYPARELPGLFEPRDMLVRVGYAIDRL